MRPASALCGRDRIALRARVDCAEAVQRALADAKASGRHAVTTEQIERILPQLLLDFV